MDPESLLTFDALLLVAAFAIAVVLLIGAAAAQTGIEKSLRASSKHAPQLSFFTVGCYMLAYEFRSLSTASGNSSSESDARMQRFSQD